MKTSSLLVCGVIFFAAVLQTNTARSFSVARPLDNSAISRYAKGTEFIKLSFKQFATLTGQKENLWNKISFNLLKNKIKRDLKKDPNLNITKYGLGTQHHTSTLVWILYGILLFLAILLVAIGIAMKK